MFFYWSVFYEVTELNWQHCLQFTDKDRPVIHCPLSQFLMLTTRDGCGNKSSSEMVFFPSFPPDKDTKERALDCCLWGGAAQMMGRDGREQGWGGGGGDVGVASPVILIIICFSACFSKTGFRIWYQPCHFCWCPLCQLAISNAQRVSVSGFTGIKMCAFSVSKRPSYQISCRFNMMMMLLLFCGLSHACLCRGDMRRFCTRVFTGIARTCASKQGTVLSHRTEIL